MSESAKAFPLVASVLVLIVFGMAGISRGQDRPENPPAPQKRSAAPLPEKKAAAAPSTETKASDEKVPVKMLPDNCAKGSAAPAPSTVGAHIVIPPGKSPKAVCDKSSVEAGQVWKGQTMTCTYTIRNTGDADLFIRPKAT